MDLLTFGSFGLPSAINLFTLDGCWNWSLIVGFALLGDFLGCILKKLIVGALRCKRRTSFPVVDWLAGIGLL